MKRILKGQSKMGKLKILESFLGLDQKEDQFENLVKRGLSINKGSYFSWMGRDSQQRGYLLFFKKSERIKYDWLYLYFLQNDWLFNKQYGFRAKNAKDHAVIEFVINIYNSSNQMNFIIVVFIDLSKAFDNVKYQNALYLWRWGLFRH